jgi:hypothetical protein
MRRVWWMTRYGSYLVLPLLAGLPIVWGTLGWDDQLGVGVSLDGRVVLGEPRFGNLLLIGGDYHDRVRTRFWVSADSSGVSWNTENGPIQARYVSSETLLILSLWPVLLYIPNVYIDTRDKALRRLEKRRCPHCAYDISGTLMHERCPECGEHWGLPRRGHWWSRRTHELARSLSESS